MDYTPTRKLRTVVQKDSFQPSLRFEASEFFKIIFAFCCVYLSHRVCRHWRRVAGDHTLWQEVDLTAFNRPIPLQQLRTFSRTHFSRKLTSLKLKGYQSAGIYTPQHYSFTNRARVSVSNNDSVSNLILTNGAKGAISSKVKHAIKHKTSPARLAQLLQPSLAFCFSLQPMSAYRLVLVIAPLMRNEMRTRTADTFTRHPLASRYSHFPACPSFPP